MNGPRQLVLGIALWSRYDLRLLSLVTEAAGRGSHPDLDVAVFNVDEIASPAELQRLLPGLGEWFHTPVVGYWVAGQLQEATSGFAARQLIGRLLGFDSEVVFQQSTPVAE
jgi:hypothetical protein